ncbi:MAG: dacF [Sporomusa sp.]|nr:dacF [Sporomusa sp.]
MRKTVLVTLLFFVLGVATALSAPATTAKLQSGAQLETSAVSAVLMDENGTVLFQKDPHKRLPPASVTKIMTLLLAVEAVEQGRINLADEVFASENAWRQGGSQIWLEPGEKMTVKDMLSAVAVVSANDAAVALMEHIYGSEQAAVEAMNNRAETLGLANTHFNNVNGLPTTDHYMSAYDAALIGREAVTHPLYMDMCGIKEAWLRDGKNWLVNTNKLFGLKTGWTEEAKYCFVGTAKRDGLRLISAVFATPEPRSHLRESMKVLDWGFANFSAVPIVTQGTIVERLKVNKGVDKELQLVAAQDLNLIIGKGQNKNLQKKIIADSAVNAPVAEGQKCGELVVLKDGKEVGKVDLLAEKSVEKAGLLRIFQNMITNMFNLSK